MTRLDVVKLKLPSGKVYAAQLDGRALRRGLRTATQAQRYGVAVANRLARWRQVGPYAQQLPFGFRDAVHNEFEISLGWRDRLRVLLGWRIVVGTRLYCETPPGRVQGESALRIERPAWLARRGAQVSEHG